MRFFRLISVVALVATGCASSPPAGPRYITFEAKGFMRSYKIIRDDVIRKTAGAVLRCEKVTAASPLSEREKCEKVNAARAEWDHRDEVVLDALLGDRPVSSFDWEKAAEAAGKFLGTAAGAL